MVKIKFYRRLQKELSTDIGIISGNILGENFFRIWFRWVSI